MRKILLTALSLLFVAAAGAQTLSEGFEGESDLPEGWTTKDTGGTKYVWSRVKHGSGSLKYRSGFTSGGTYTMQTQAGKTSTTNPAPDMWLVTPQVSVQSGDYLSFMLAYAPVFNMAGSTTEASRTKFQVLVSETDTAKASFTPIYEFTPMLETDWRSLCFSLDQYAGKTVYIAFREFGTTTKGPVSTNYMWLDDVKVQQGGSSDCVVVALDSPESGYQATQNVTVKVFNGALPAVNPVIGYKAGTTDAVTETYEGTIATGDTLTYTFASPLTLQRGVATDLSAWVTADNDGNHDNDTIKATITADNLFTLPYAMTTSNNSVGWDYTYHKKSGRNYTGWWNTADTAGEQLVWKFTACQKTSLLQGKWFALPKGKVKATFDYTTTIDAPMTVSLLDVEGNTVGSFSVTLPAASERTAYSQTFSVDSLGDYTLSIQVSDSYLGGTLQLYGLALEEQVPGDVAVTAISKPVYNALPTTAPVAVVAKVENKGETAVENIPVHVSVDGTETLTATIDKLEGGASVDYAFADSLALTAGNHDIAVYTTLEDDKELGNDTTAVTVYGYEPRVFPLKENFEDEDQAKQWITYNADGDQLAWGIDYAITSGVNYAKDGDHAAYMASLSGTEHNDWLVSPAFTVGEATKARLSYYYTTRYKASETDSTALTAYLVKGPELTLPTDGAPLSSVLVTDNNVGTYAQAYALADITEAGTYYIAIHNGGQGHDVVLDDLRFDADADLAIVGASHTAQTGFSLKADKVTVLVANHGATARSGFTINALLNGEQKLSTNYMGTLEPGDTLSYAFSSPLDISAPGTYAVTLNVSDSGDSDDFNNAWAFDAYTNYAVATLPYEANFDDADQQAQWTLNGGWQTGTYSSSSSAYNGTGAVSHHKAAAEEGDWAFSGAIDIPAGTYDLDFFFRTYLNGRTANLYKQSFALYLGQEATAGAMTQLLYQASDTIAAEKRYKRVRQTFTVAESGTYYIGIQCTSQASYGVLYVDQLTISESVQPTVALESYEDSNLGAWYHYDPSTQFSQWTSIDGGTGVTAQVKVYSVGNAQEVPGALVLYPGFYIGAGETLSAEIDYSQSADEALTADQQTQVTTGLYLGQSDMPEAFTTPIVTGNDISGEQQTAKGSVTVADAGVYWMALQVAAPANGDANTTTLTYNVYRIKVVAEQATGISRVLFTSDAPVDVYTVGGLFLGSFDTAAEAQQRLTGKGAYILRQGQTTLKLMGK